MGKIIAFSNQKGGVGKTTTVLNVADYVARAGKRVLMIDIDPQGNLTSGYGIEKNKLENSLYDLMTGEASFKEVVTRTAYENLDILPCNMDLASLEVELSSVPNRTLVLAKSLKGHVDDYDFVMIDCPPSLGVLTLNALCACDGVVVPIQSEFFALEGIVKLLQTFELVKKRLNPKLNLLGVVLTMYDARNRLTREVRDEVQRCFPDHLFETVIPRNVRLSEAPSPGKSIIHYDIKSKGADAYLNLAKEVALRDPARMPQPR